VPSHGRFLALKRAVSMGQTAWRTMLHETYKWGLLHSFREEMKNYHALFKQKPSSLLMLLDGTQFQLPLWWYCLCTWIWWRRYWYPELMMCSAMADLSGCSRCMCWWCSLILVSVKWRVCLCRFVRIHISCYIPGVFSHKLWLAGCRKPEIFLGGRLKDFMLLHILKESDWARVIMDSSALMGGLRALWTCQLL
jgi:hypothetical protein